MARYSRRKRIARAVLAASPFLSEPFLRGSKKDFVCYLPPGNRRRGGIITGPDDEWKPLRDSELCNQIWKRTGCTVRACYYAVGSSATDKEGVRKPHMWIRNLFDWVKAGKYQRLHLVGYSGGALLASSQLAFRGQDPIVRTLTLIAGDVAAGLDAAHSNAAFFADRIQARTRLIYGTGDDGAKRGALKWEMRNSQADIQPYEGGHDFYKDGQFTKISQMVVDWLLEEPAIKRLARRKMHETVRRKQKKKVKA